MHFHPDFLKYQCRDKEEISATCEHQRGTESPNVAIIKTLNPIKQFPATSIGTSWIRKIPVTLTGFGNRSLESDQNLREAQNNGTKLKSNACEAPRLTHKSYMQVYNTVYMDSYWGSDQPWLSNSQAAQKTVFYTPGFGNNSFAEDLDVVVNSAASIGFCDSGSPAILTYVDRERKEIISEVVGVSTRVFWFEEGKYKYIASTNIHNRLSGIDGWLREIGVRFSDRFGKSNQQLIGYKNGSNQFKMLQMNPERYNGTVEPFFDVDFSIAKALQGQKIVDHINSFDFMRHDLNRDYIIDGKDLKIITNTAK